MLRATACSDCHLILHFENLGQFLSSQYGIELGRYLDISLAGHTVDCDPQRILATTSPGFEE